MNQERPLVRIAYQHFKGGIYVVLGFAEEEKTGEEVVIYSDLANGKSYVRPIKDFFALHPTLKVPRFVAVTPQVKK